MVAVAHRRDDGGMETFGEALRRWRGELPIRELARRAHCGKSHISTLESGRSFPSLRIAAALDKTLNAGGELVELAGRPPAADATDISTSVASPAWQRGRSPPDPSIRR